MPLNKPNNRSLILKVILSIIFISSFVAQSKVKICSFEIRGSSSSSFLKQYSNKGFSKTVPSGIPNLFVKDPVAIFLTINSIGKISAFLISCSLMLRLLTKCVLIPHCERFVKIYSEILLFKTPLPSTLAFFKLLKAVASSLKCCITKFLSLVS